MTTRPTGPPGYSTTPATGVPRSQATRPPALPPASGPDPATPPSDADVSPANAALALGRRALKLALYVIVPAIMLLAMAAGVLFVRLRHGPISFDVLVLPMERGINAELANNSVKIKGAELRLGSDGNFEFRLRNVSVLETDGDVVASAPLAAVSISAAALWRARIVPERIELIDPVIRLLYTEDNGLTLSAVREELSESSATGTDGEQKLSGQAPGAELRHAPAVATTAVPARQISLARMLSDSSNKARKRLGATSYLTEFGLRNTTVELEYAGQRSSWQVPSVDVDFNHGKTRSVISGRATVSSPKGPWAVSFLTDESDKTDKVTVKTTVRDLVPSTLAAAAPPLALLRMFDMTVAGDATINLATSGDIEKAEIALEVGTGRISLPGASIKPFNITAGLFQLSFDGKERSWTLGPSPVKWAEGNGLFSGAMRDIGNAKSPPIWHFTLDGRNAMIEANDLKLAPVPIDVWTATGDIIPRQGVVSIGEFRLKGGGGEAVMKGITRAGPAGQSSRAEMTISPMPLATLKALWPRAIAPNARAFVGERVTAAEFKGGKVTFASGEFLTGEAPALAEKGERLSATFEFNDGIAVPLDGMVPVSAPRTLIRLENGALEIAVPDAAAVLPGNRRVPIKALRITSADVVPDRPDGEISFSITSPLGPFLEILETLPIKAVREASPLPKAADGKIDGQFKLKMPLVSGGDLEAVTFEGKAKVTDGRFGKVGGQFDVQGFTLLLDATDKALDAKGDLLVNGVPAKITGQRIFGAANDQQPPFKITATIDDADRTQLGLDINDLVRGAVPIEVSLQKGQRPEPVIKLKADLTNAELVFEQLAWRKASGRAAIVEADVLPGKTHKTELQNFKVAGDDIAIEGWLGIGADNKMREFYFPAFSLNVVSRLEVQGLRGNDDIWNVKAHGNRFDGRDVFHSLFSVGPDGEHKVKAAKPAAGIDLAAEIDTVIGASDVSLHGLKLKLSSRAEKLTALDVKGTLDGGQPLAVVLGKSSGPRRLVADSTDAGQTLKLIGLYPNMQGGRLKLEVNLDGKGPAEKTGVLLADDFKVLGDPIISEVVSSADQGRPAIGGNKKVTREVFEFDHLKAPFSIGYGQLALEDSYVKGPLAGANVRGKVDFKTRRIDLGGTYVPLQGLNGAFGNIPLLGQLISGTNGEGIFGITFAVQGALSEPQVIVNPLSMVAPGIFREMFQLTNPDSRVQVREDRAPAKPVEQRVRASSTPAEGAVVKKAPQAVKAAPQIGDSWSPTTTPGRN